VSERSERISKLLKSHAARAAYIKAKLSVLIPAQIRTLRAKSIDPPMPYQRDLARESDLHQSRISMFETPGAANMTVETIAKIAAALRVGVVIKFVPFSDMVRWENSFSPDTFDVVRLQEDRLFVSPDDTAKTGHSRQLGGLESSSGNQAGAMKMGVTASYESLECDPHQNAIGA
jgi:transcriptional regulator with XRE-family HTH domain